ncbi:MAG: divalent-cation tolerance protein CutA [Methanimicrococcus sp.]|nr:divalent-cation tolerance protein CutA [Methanimicrococcus sp.]
MTNESSDYILVYAAFPTKKEAELIAEYLIEKKLIVCANIRKHKTVYVWKEKTYKEKEFGAFLKTREDKWEEIKEYILKNHSYEVPVILKICINDVNDSFKHWADDNLLVRLPD